MEQGHIGSYGAYIPDKGLLAPVHPELLGYGGGQGSPLDCVPAVNRALPVVAVAARTLGLPWCLEGTQTIPPGFLSPLFHAPWAWPPGVFSEPQTHAQWKA